MSEARARTSPRIAVKCVEDLSIHFDETYLFLVQTRFSQCALVTFACTRGAQGAHRDAVAGGHLHGIGPPMTGIVGCHVIAC